MVQNKIRNNMAYYTFNLKIILYEKLPIKKGLFHYCSKTNAAKRCCVEIYITGVAASCTSIHLVMTIYTLDSNINEAVQTISAILEQSRFRLCKARQYNLAPNVVTKMIHQVHIEVLIAGRFISRYILTFHGQQWGYLISVESAFAVKQKVISYMTTRAGSDIAPIWHTGPFFTLKQKR